MQHLILGITSTGHGTEPEAGWLGLVCVYRFDSSPFSSGCEWKATDPLPTLESHWADFCKRKLIENKKHFAFSMTKAAFLEEQKEVVFLVFNYSFVANLDRPLIGTKCSNS